MVDEDEVGDHHCACPRNVSEKTNGRIHGVEGVSGDIEHQVVEAETLHPEEIHHYDLYLKFS